MTNIEKASQSLISRTPALLASCDSVEILIFGRGWRFPEMTKIGHRRIDSRQIGPLGGFPADLGGSFGLGESFQRLTSISPDFCDGGGCATASVKFYVIVEFVA